MIAFLDSEELAFDIGGECAVSGPVECVAAAGEAEVVCEA